MIDNIDLNIIEFKIKDNIENGKYAFKGYYLMYENSNWIYGQSLEHDIESIKIYIGRENENIVIIE